MKKICNYLFHLLWSFGLLQTSLLAQTNIESANAIILPEGTNTSYTVGSGQSLTVKSAVSITLKAGVTFQSGAVVLLHIGNVGTPPVDPEPQGPIRNWIQTRSFGYAGNKTGESRSYFDDTGASMQTLSRDLVNGNVLVSSTIHDAQNNPALTTLPIPVTGIPTSSTLEYKEDILVSSNGQPYSYKDFSRYRSGTSTIDKRYNANTPATVTPSTVGWYYSDNNVQEGYADISSNPYVVQLSSHPLVSKTAGISDAHKMGQGHESITYSAPARNEINHYLKVRNKFFTEAEVGKHVIVTNAAVSTISVNENGDASVQISLSGNPIISAIPGNDLVIANGVNFYAAAWSGQKDVLLPILADQTINVWSGTGTITNLSGNEQVVSATSSVPLTRGLYELRSTADGSLTYQTGLADISYNFYSEKGLLLASIAPEGVKLLLGTGIDNYSSLSSIPHTTLYEYDSRGFLAAGSSTNQGRTEYANRPDGAIRFSQNALQRASNKASYTNYDSYGRVIENGEVSDMASFSSTWMNGNNQGVVTTLNYTGTDRFLHFGGGQKASSDVVQYLYDEVDNSHNQSGYTQDPFFVQGTLSTVSKYKQIPATGTAQSADLISKTWYSYNGDGQLLWQIKYIEGLGYKTTDNEYDQDGRLVKSIYQKNTALERMVYYYEYDANGALLATYTNTDDNPYTKLLHTKQYYYAHGGLKRMELGDQLQGLDYVYTVDGKLKAINHVGSVGGLARRNKASKSASAKSSEVEEPIDPEDPIDPIDPEVPLVGLDPGNDGISNGFAPDVFAMNFEYYLQDYQRAGTGIASIQTGSTTANYAGLPNGISWNVTRPVSMGGVSLPIMNTYSYDQRYSLLQNNWGSPDFINNTFNGVSGYQEKGLSYDSHGNIKTLQRTGASGSVVDNYQYNYTANSNKLASVYNTVSSNNYASYTYDALGQLASETKGSQSKYLTYDVYGKVTGIYSDAAKTQPVVTFVYDENGARIKKQDHLQGVTTWYVDGNVYSGSQLIEQAIPSGIYYRQGGVYRYQLTDHVGSVRSIINRDKLWDGTADVVYSADYYPFGTELNAAGIPSRYGYQGEYAEKDGETGWNNFYLRNYDPAIGRWLSVDPYGQYDSPYVGMGNNPVSGFDPDGGWDWLTARVKWWQSFSRGEKPSRIYKKDGEHGFNFTPKNVETDAGGIATVYAGSSFGPNRKMQEVTNSLPQTAFLNPSTGNYDYAKASGRVDPSYVEFEAILTAYSGGQYLLARQAAKKLALTGGELIADDVITLTTSSVSTSPSRTYTIFDGSGKLYKFGVTDADLVRYGQSLKEAGPGAYGRYSGVMPKFQAHRMEKYLRSLHYHSTGQYALPGMKIPYPVNFDTGLPIRPQ